MSDDVRDLLCRIERRAHKALLRNAHGHMCEFRQEIDAILSLATLALTKVASLSDATQAERAQTPRRT